MRIIKGFCPKCNETKEGYCSYGRDYTCWRCNECHTKLERVGEVTEND